MFWISVQANRLSNTHSRIFIYCIFIHSILLFLILSLSLLSYTFLSLNPHPGVKLRKISTALRNFNTSSPIIRTSKTFLMVAALTRRNVLPSSIITEWKKTYTEVSRYEARVFHNADNVWSGIFLFQDQLHKPITFDSRRCSIL